MAPNRSSKGNNLTITIYVQNVAEKVQEYQRLFKTEFSKDGVNQTQINPKNAHVTLVFMRVAEPDGTEGDRKNVTETCSRIANEIKEKLEKVAKSKKIS